MGIEKYFHKVAKPVLFEKDRYIKVLNSNGATGRGGGGGNCPLKF
jgi:hypothetical protein